MSDFEYKVSVIVPVYNVEQYLRDCLDSLLAQTIDHDQMEVLLINDGSTDNSLAICEEYAELFSCFKLFSKENEGLSATRNYGIERAKGKYLMYIDSDDMFTPETVKAVTDFFDTVYDEVDLVTYLDQPYRNGVRMKPHFRYNYLKKSGVYDLKKYPFICQTRVNICVKNLHGRNPLFDTTPNFRHEDQEYNNRILAKKGKIGYCDKGEYKYIRNDTSIMAVYMYPMYIFDTTMKYYESLFDQYNNTEVPEYLQAMFIHDMSWKIKESVLFPYHFSGKEYDNAMHRIVNILDKINDWLILNHPSADAFHKHFFLNMKSNARNTVVMPANKMVSVYKNGLCLYSTEKFEIILNKIRVDCNKFQLLGFLKSQLFNYIEAPKIEAVVTRSDGSVENVDLDLFLSSWSWYKTKEQTNYFYGFYFNYNADELCSFYIQVIVDGIRYNTYYWFMPTAPYSNKIKRYEAIFSQYKVVFNKNVFSVEKIPQSELKNMRKLATIKNRPSLYGIRSEADSMCSKEIWLYYDCRGVKKDNGYYQFIHDLGKNDGIERFYINANDEVTDIFDNKQRQRVVKFGSIKHKILYVAASKIITAYVEDKNINPFEADENEYVTDILNFEIIYLQHGILHAHLPWKYSPGRVNCDKVVISSYFEKENFTKTYNFPSEALIECGMPRFDHIDKNAEPSNRILFAPSWRNYLIGEAVGNEWTLTEGKFLKSDYFQVFNDFLNSPELEHILEENDLYLDFKIHPIFAPYLQFFDRLNSRVSFAGSSVKDEEYAAFITDFSSFVFDFVYLKRPIMYFVPDMPQFKSGMNQYRELDLPFEKAFGNLVTDVESAVEELSRIIEEGLVPNQIFKERMDIFYLPLENCSEKLYQYLMSDKNQLQNLIDKKEEKKK